METTTFPADTVLFHKGDGADAAYLVQSGAVEISIGEGEGRKILGEITDGGLFGEMALITDDPRMATARTKVETTCYVVPESVFKSTVDKTDAFTRALILGLIGHIRSHHDSGDWEAEVELPAGENPEDQGAQFYMPQVGGGYKEK